MKRKWLYIGVAVAAVLQFFFEGLWHEVLFKHSYPDIQPILRDSPKLIFNFLSEVGFASVVGFFYLHVPDLRRGMRTGATIGTILGFLIALYQFFDWYGSFNVSVYVVSLEIVKTTILGTICGLAISYAELRTKKSTPSV
jgi:hypothetical protein